MNPPLHGVRVLDLSRVLAGPWATMQLADLGAEVIKVERPGAGDDTRAWGPPWFENEAGERLTSSYYLSANRNKKSVAIDLASEKGQAIVRALAAKSDIVVENFKQGGLKAYGLDWEALKAVNPRLVYCSITGFGQDGPRAHEAGYDFMIQGMSGLMSVTGPIGGEPYRVGVALADVLTGLNATIAILAALRHAEATGEGQQIDVALFDVAVASMANQALGYLVSGEAPGRIGNTHPSITPYQAFPTKDGHIILAIGNDGQFSRFVRQAGRPELADDPRFTTNALRTANRPALVPIVTELLAARTTAEWMALLSQHAVPCGPINSLDATFADPQAGHRGLRLAMPSAHGQVPGVRSPHRLSASPAVEPVAPPMVGENSAEVLSGLLGLDAAEIAALAASGVIAGSR
ncbi:CaiB/BaiF CoA-transferase family protein [Sphingomonas sp. LaA6.9]|uniref:CaiB/BaiF CoA transferase family protein n=1 Tax=Sphingomonas sp. LaA6.9 TaxID=2919914 RepID=UPI001F4F23E2|nr:CaiB/BaiF CoA-transferase family protein [Sphingomonas sp. LaA6.9]MCJ8159833.1 CoA transferase [Sphingomonas sp. LaA6.9]